MDGNDAPSGGWHGLFDRLCLEQGHFDCKTLAGLYCDFLGKENDAAAFDAAVKSLNNWRQGHHTPTRRNFRILTILLEVQDRRDVLEPWNALYEDALRRDSTAEGGADAPVEPELRKFQFRWIAAGVIGVVVVVAVFAMVWQQNGAPKRLVIPPGPPVIDMSGQRIYWREVSELSVGESVVIHGKRGDRCAEQPPPWAEVLPLLPQLSTGVWSDGGVGYRISRSCGGPTPARAVVFTATRAGVDKFMLYEDPITVTVK